MRLHFSLQKYIVTLKTPSTRNLLRYICCQLETYSSAVTYSLLITAIISSHCNVISLLSKIIYFTLIEIHISYKFTLLNFQFVRILFSWRSFKDRRSDDLNFKNLHNILYLKMKYENVRSNMCLKIILNLTYLVKYRIETFTTFLPFR